MDISAKLVRLPADLVNPMGSPPRAWAELSPPKANG